MYSRNPRVGVELDIRVDNPEEARSQAAAERLAEIHNFLQTRMRYAQAQYADSADAHRLPAPAFRPGDLVFLDTRNIRTTEPCCKLDDKNAGPFEVIGPVGTRAYELDLPAEMDLRTRVSHTSLLELARRDPQPGQANAPLPPVVVRDHEEWLVWNGGISLVYGRLYLTCCARVYDL